MPEGLLKLDRGHILPAADMLAKAFFSDPMYEFILPDSAERQRALPVIFRGMLSVLVSSGGVYATSENLEGVVCVSGLDNSRGRLGQLSGIFGALGMPFRVMRRVAVLPMMRRAGAMRRGVSEYRRIKERLEGGVYIDLIAVAEEHRGRGLMSLMMRPVLLEAAQAGKSCALDTESEGNIPIYEHFGFHLIKTIEAVPGRLNFHMLACEPTIQSTTQSK